MTSPLADPPNSVENDPEQGAPLITTPDYSAEDKSNTPLPTLGEAVESLPESTRSLLEKRLRGRFIAVSRLPRNALIK